MVTILGGVAIGADVVSNARQAAEDLRAEISADPPREEAWQRLLDWPALEQQLELGQEADTTKLTEIAEQLVRTESVLDAPRTRAVADALENWQAELPQVSDAAKDQLQAAYDDFYTWLDRNRRRAPAWRALLRGDDIESALSDPGRLTAEEVQALAQLHVAEAAASDRERFVALRRALRDWIVAIQQPLGDPLARAAREAGSRYQEVQPTQLAAARRQLRDAVTRLQRFLNKGSAQKREGWQSFLVWDDLVGELSGDGPPTIRMLAGPYNRFDSGYPGLELKPFADVREVLKKYLELLQLSETQGQRREEQRQRLADDVAALDRFLASGGEAKESGWKRYLEWDAMQEELAGSAPISACCGGSTFATAAARPVCGWHRSPACRDVWANTWRFCSWRTAHRPSTGTSVSWRVWPKPSSATPTVLVTTRPRTSSADWSGSGQPDNSRL